MSQLLTATPTEGPKIGVVYTFPTEYGDVGRGGDMDTSSATKSDGSDGFYDTRGAMAFLLNAATLQTTLDFNEHFYTTNGIGGNAAGAAYMAVGGNGFWARDQAVLDIVLFLIKGGELAVTAQMLSSPGAPGTPLALSGKFKVSAWNFPYTHGDPTIRPQLTLMCMSGGWTATIGGVAMLLPLC